MSEEYHQQTVKVVIKKNSAIYRQIAKYAVANSLTVEAVIDSLITLESQQAIKNGMARLERKK